MIDIKAIMWAKKKFLLDPTIENAKAVFMCNNHYKTIYDNASENVKKFYEVEYFGSLMESGIAWRYRGQSLETMYRDVESNLTSLDWQYIIDHCNSQIARCMYRKKQAMVM